MIEIKGKVNTAICYATVVEDEAIEQIRRMCDYDFTAGSQIRIMPDVHAGKGCTIGTTMTITDKAVPNIVGVDIGCGMYTAELGKVDVDFEKVDAAAHYIPSGRDVWEGRMERFDLTGLRCYRNLKQAKRLERSLGTLGGGNHFIEIDAASDGTKYLVIHSGSRNLGKQVAELYQTLAIDLNAGKADYFERRDELIRTYKEQGRRAEIQTALKAMEKEWAAKEPTIPADLCYLYGSLDIQFFHSTCSSLLDGMLCDLCLVRFSTSGEFTVHGSRVDTDCHRHLIYCFALCVQCFDFLSVLESDALVRFSRSLIGCHCSPPPLFLGKKINAPE